MKKIIYIDNFLSKHGSVPSIGEFITDALQKEGYNIITTSSVKNKTRRLFDMLFTIGLNRKNSIVLIATYSTSAFYFAYACGRLCTLLKVKYIPCLHGGNLPERIKRNQKLSAQLFNNSYTNVVVSKYLQQAMNENNWSTLLIENPIEIKNYPFKKRNNPQPNLLWVRAFHQLYNPQMALKILAELRKIFPSATLAMVGPDRDGTMSNCVRLSKELQLEKCVQFTGLLSKEEWIKLSEDYDIFINTTNFDNLPVSVIEAMALGMIVISTNVGGLKHLIKNNVNGILLNPNDVNAFVHNINAIIRNKDLSERISINARATAEEYNWNNIKEKWNCLLQKETLYHHK